MAVSPKLFLTSCRGIPCNKVARKIAESGEKAHCQDLNAPQPSQLVAGERNSRGCNKPGPGERTNDGKLLLYYFLLWTILAATALSFFRHLHGQLCTRQLCFPCLFSVPFDLCSASPSFRLAGTGHFVLGSWTR